ncbi:MAG: SGNH/GDSL hydrolase family protein [Nitrospirota bacterium]
MTYLSDTPGRSFAQPSLNWSVIVALFALEGSCGLALLALYKKGEQGFSSFIQTNAGMFFIISLAVLAISAGWIGCAYFLSNRNALRAFQLTVAMNLVTVIFVLVCSELAVRVLAKRTPEGDAINGMLLFPKNWDRMRSHYLAVWKKASGDNQEGITSDVGYVVYDRDLGWSIGPNRRSANGLYFSNPQGLRAPRTGESFPLPQAAPWIAALGDSFTFGEEVAYEDTWAARLEKLLGGRFAVANFGVAGYGVDQAYLRYLRDVRPWRPTVAVLGFISNNLFRSTTVYTFLNFPEWENPFSKPRFLATAEGLRLLNVPTIPPATIFSKSAITELPYLRHDMGYTPLEWQHEWYHSSYFARFLLTRFPRWTPLNANASEEAVFSLNERVLRSFIEQTTESGTIPVIAYFPTAGDFHPQRPNLTGKTFLQRTGIPYIDPTSCLLQVPEAERFQPGGHYSPRGNAAVAECLAESLRQITALSGRQPAYNAGSQPTR